MTEREKQIAAAALRVFSRYGVKRATMNDVAEEAGVVRQTLYNVFPNKDEVLRGTIRYFSQQQIDLVTAGWRPEAGLAGNLDLMFQHLVSDIWDAIQSSPDAAEFEQGFNEAGRAELEQVHDMWRKELAKLFVPYAETLTERGQSVPAFADYLHVSMIGLKYGAKTRPQLDALWVAHKAALIAFLAPRTALS